MIHTLVRFSAPGRENEAFFKGMIDEAHRAGMRVHAWFPICFDPQRLKTHPEWGMVNSDGVRSVEWVCPTNIAWRQEFLALFKNLLDNYGVDGIHFDDIRFPSADVCHCRACRSELSRRASVDWPLGLELIDQTDTQAVWFDYRTGLIRDLTEELGAAIRKWREGVIVSAALEPEGAISFDGVKLYGQSYRELARRARLRRAHGLPPGRRRARKLGAGRADLGSLAVWIHARLAGYSGVRRSIAFADEPGRFRASARLDALRQRRCGAVRVGAHAFPRHRGGEPRQHAAGRRRPRAPLGARSPRCSAGHRECAVRAGRCRGEIVFFRTHVSSSAGWSNSAGMDLGHVGRRAAIGVLWAVRSRSKASRQALPELPLSVLEALAAEPRLTGPLAAVIVHRLHALCPDELEWIRTHSLLFRLLEAGGQFPDVGLDAIDPGRLALTRAKEAGWIRNAGESWCLTPEGRQMLKFMASREDSRHWRPFVDRAR